MYFIENACKIIFSESQNSCDKEFLNIPHMYFFKSISELVNKMKMRLLRNSNCTGANSNELIQNHPWDIQSVHELLYFNCPSCVFKDHCKQKLINHAYDHHPGINISH